jgi:hypothetical protein
MLEVVLISVEVIVGKSLQHGFHLQKKVSSLIRKFPGLQQFIIKTLTENIFSFSIPHQYGVELLIF